MIRLGDLLLGVPHAKLRGSRACEIGALVLDSREARPGVLFAALRGTRSDGRLFVEEAVQRGASAVLSEPPRPQGLGSHVAWIESAQPRETLALIARTFFGAPDRQLDLVGVTGTDGKTTTSHLLSSALFASGVPTALGGTLGQRFGADARETALTTPEAPALYEFLADSALEGADAAVIEVSSAALVARRVHGMSFAGAILTGIGHDHLDLHEDVESYRAAKRMLFEMLPASAFAVLPGDDPQVKSFREAAGCPVTTFGETKACDWKIRDHQPAASSATFTLDGPGFGGKIEINRPAAWDARNLAAAVAAAVALGASPESAIRGAASCPPIPGRWEAVDGGQPFAAVVDYAHTPEALERALVQLRRSIEGKSVLVFGCGGGRDRDKRALMGSVAGRHADMVFVTDDNPRDEDPEQIAAPILAALRKSGTSHRRIADRAEAIRAAVASAAESDGVLVAGKGHEAWQIVGPEERSFDDREQLLAAISSTGVRR